MLAFLIQSYQCSNQTDYCPPQNLAAAHKQPQQQGQHKQQGNDDQGNLRRLPQHLGHPMI
ncbi:MAG: hypothetical protein HS126_02105 [Anaerolineales bacterium]|nr:hypothetical protein [Anaerolineales bacterium]